ncbi:MAG: EAL domain-containing protein [Oscillospiraceae bacterium]|nr:EAL domain-containing protein [Oscillospiraceae bacterium]
MEDKRTLSEPQLKQSPYTVEELRAFMSGLEGRYDLARVVDPVECRKLELQEDGKVEALGSCYSIWNADQKCKNCSSAVACRTGCHQEKLEHYQDRDYFIQSNPVSLRLEDGSVYNAVIELVNIRQETAQGGNDRAAENENGNGARYQAQHDSLTGALTADAFYEQARKTIQGEPTRAWVVITANIVNFRLVNTLFGVMKGNEVLVRTAALLRELAERADGLCGRLGADQFALLLPRAQYRENDLLLLARSLEKTFHSGLYTFCIHFGVCRVDDASLPVSVLCGRANSALYTIRDDLTQTVAYFNDDILQNMLREQKVISSFDEALRSGQFQMYLQPLVKEDGIAVGAEALVRWRKPDGTMVMPGAFIGILENAGLIQKLDLYIWERAVQQLRAWQNTHRSELTISVNMSAKDFYSLDVYEVLTGLVERYGVDAAKLRLEITETALLVEPDKSIAIVSALREKGFLVEIDDFGKGYSSLSLLKNIQADVLKIDMGFLQEIRDRKRSGIILKSVINMAGLLGMEVITEGVETREQLAALADMGCSRFQGFYFSRPIPVEEFETRFAAEG